jgi:hypothetical protein
MITLLTSAEVSESARAFLEDVRVLARCSSCARTTA